SPCITRYAARLHSYSFPTRRSSDLPFSWMTPHPKNHNQTNHLAPASYDESFAEYNWPTRYYNKELKSSNPDVVLLEASPDLLKLTSSHFPQHHESIYFCPLSV